MNKTVTIVASGYSLIDFDFSKLEGDIFVINYTYKYCNYTNVVCWDSNSLKKISKEVDNKKIITTKLSASINNIKEALIFETTLGKGIVREPGKVIYYNSTVVLAINAALNLGYKKIILLGCDNDMREKVHFYDTTKPTKRELKRLPGVYKLFNKFYLRISEALKPDEKIITIDSSIPYFENISMNEYLNNYL